MEIFLIMNVPKHAGIFYCSCKFLLFIIYIMAVALSFSSVCFDSDAVEM